MLNTGKGGSSLAYKYLIKPLSRQKVHALRSEKSFCCGGRILYSINQVELFISNHFFNFSTVFSFKAHFEVTEVSTEQFI